MVKALFKSMKWPAGLTLLALLFLLAPEVARAQDAGPIIGSEAAEVGFTLPADVPTSIDSFDAVAQFALLLVRAVQSKDWQFAVGLLLLLAMLGLRKFAGFIEGKKEGWMGDLAAFFGTQFGGTILLFLTAVIGGLGSAMLGHVPVTPGLFLDVTKMALMTAGGWSAIVKPAWEWFKARRAAPVVGTTVGPTQGGFVTVWVLLALVGLILTASVARAALPAYGVVGHTTLSAATAKKLVTRSLTGRRTIAVANCDAVRIWCDFTSSVSTTSWPVEPGCGKEAFDLGPEAELWCYSVAGTAADAVRVIETR